MYTVTKFCCEICGEEFDNENEAFIHELEHSFTSEIKEAIHLYNSSGLPMSFSIGEEDLSFYIKCDTVEAWDALEKLYTDYAGVEFPKAKTAEEKTSEWYYQDG